MADARALSTARLQRLRAGARRGLLATATATIAVAVATVCALLAWLGARIASAGDAAPPGVPDDEVAAQVAVGTNALISAAPALVLLVLVLAATAAVQLARLLSAAREQESANLLARGLSHRQAWALGAVEALAVGAIGALLGAALAAVVLALAGVEGSVGVLASLWWVAIGTALLLALVFVTASRPRASGSTRAARATTMAAVVLILAAAAFVTWQLRLARPTGFDPIVAVAPTVVLLAGAVLALALFGAAAAAATVPAATRPSVAPAYPARQVARRLDISAVAVLLVGLTVAEVVFAAAYGATWTAMASDSAALRTGADLRVDLDPQTASPDVVADAAAVAGVDAVAPALVAPIEIGSTDTQLIAVPTAAIGSVVTDAGGVVDLPALEEAVAPAEGSVAADPLDLGASATGVQITAALTASRENVLGSVAVSVTVLDATGASARLRLEGPLTPQPDGSSTLIGAADLPRGAPPWSLLAVSAALPASFAAATVDIELVAAEAVGGEMLEVDGGAQLSESADEQVLWLADATDGADPPAEGDAAAEDAPPVRAALTEALAQRLGLAVGDVVEFRYAGTGRRGDLRVADIVSAVPGAATALAAFAPLDVLDVSMLQRGTTLVLPASVWGAGDPSAGPALSAALGDQPVATSAPGVAATIVGSLVPGWWIAAGGSVVLSLIAAFAIVQTFALARRRELGVLRALGVRAASQGRMRAGELAAVSGASVLLGAAAGAVSSWLIVPDLVRAVTPGILASGTPVTLSWPGLVLAIGALVAGLAAIIALAGVRVRRAATGATVGEDSR